MMYDVLTEIRDLLSASMTTRCASYFVGRSAGVFMAQNSLPALIVRNKSTKLERQGTAKDRYTFNIGILVITDMVTNFKETGVSNRIILSDAKLIKIFEEKDTDGAPMSDTVMGTLMKQSNIRGTSFAYNLNPVINYEVESPPGFFYVAGEMTLTVIAEFVTRKS